MKAVRFYKHGKSRVLKLENVPEPTEPGPGEVLVSLKAAALNHLDIWVRNGLPGMSIPLPHIPGSDGSGVIQDCGPGVQDFKAGDRLLAYTDGLIEAMDEKRNYFGHNKTVAIIKSALHLKAEGVTSQLLQELNEFTRGAALADDVTLLVVDYDRESENNKPV